MGGMEGPVRAVKTTTISILAIGLLAGSAVGVAAQDDGADQAGAVVSGSFDPIGGASEPCEPEGDFAVTEGDPGDGSFVWADCIGFVMDDPRLTGTGSAVRSERAYDGFWVLTTELEIANDSGSWSGTGTNVSTDGDDAGASIDIEQLVLTGAGGYEGLTAILYTDGSFAFRGLKPINGVIIPAEMPDLPAE